MLQTNESTKIAIYRRITTSTGIGGGISANQHRSLDQLVHLISENSYYERNYSSGKLNSEIWWIDVSKTTKIREIIRTYTGWRVSQKVTKQYNISGSLVETFTETISRDCIERVTSVTGVLT